MQALSQFEFQSQAQIQILLTDIDGTLTDKEGKIPRQSYYSLWELCQQGIKTIPVTGRSAGWCEMIARTWPVQGVIGENGAFYFYLQANQLKKIFFLNKKNLKEAQEKRQNLEKDLLQQIPEVAFATDQFCRLSDLAIDIGEERKHITKTQQEHIFSICGKHGAQAKLSSIHINAWFGSYDKLSTSLHVLKEHHALNEKDIVEKVAFIGDSPNDAPMFAHFPHSFGVANIAKFTKTELPTPPTYLSPEEGAQGFVAFAQLLLKASAKKT